MIEQQNNEVLLPEEDPKLWWDVCGWIRYGFSLKVHDDDEALRAMELYILADKYFMLEFENGIVDSLKIYWKHTIVHPRLISWLLGKINDSDPLYGFALDALVANLRTNFWAYKAGSEDPELRPALEDLLANRVVSMDLLWRLIDWNEDDKAPWDTDVCRYHVHEGDKSCMTESSESDSDAS